MQEREKGKGGEGLFLKRTDKNFYCLNIASI